jgi:hypothetical protein
VGIGNLSQASRSQVQGFIPADPLPTRVWVAFWTGTFERIEQAVWVIHKFWRGPAFGAQGLPGRVRRVWLEGNEVVVLDDPDGAAPGDAERTIPLDSLR